AEYVAFGEADHAVRAFLAEPDQRPSAAVDGAQGGAAAGVWRGKMRFANDLRGGTLPRGGVDPAVAHEARQRCLVEMRELAPAGFAEMAARRRDVMRTVTD